MLLGAACGQDDGAIAAGGLAENTRGRPLFADRDAGDPLGAFRPPLRRDPPDVVEPDGALGDVLAIDVPVANDQVQ